MADKEVQIKNAAGSGAKKTHVPQKNAEVSSEGSSHQGKTQVRKVPAQKTPSGRESIDKEVLLIVREMNQKLNSQDERLKKQEEKLENLSGNLNYDENYQNFDNEQECTDDASESQSFNHDTGYFDAASSASEQSVIMEKSIYKTVADKIKQKEVVDNEINEDFASFVKSSFRDGIGKQKMDELIHDTHRPQNCDSLVKTKVNQGIWRLLRPSTHFDDDRMLTIQENIVKVACNFVKLIDKSSDKFDNQDMEWGHAWSCVAW